MENSLNLIIKSSKICRICLEESDNLSPLFKNNQNQEQPKYPGLAEKIRECGDIKLNEDKEYLGVCISPFMICDSCVENAIISYKFRLQCQHSAKRLRLYREELIQSNLEVSASQTDSLSQSQDLSISTEDIQSSDEFDERDDNFSPQDEIEEQLVHGDAILQQLLDALTQPNV